MKRTLFLLILFCSSFQTFGQLPFSFPNNPTIEATWLQRRYTPADPADPQQTITEYYYFYNNYGVDTINGVAYNKLYVHASDLIAHYRVDGSKVYYRTDYANTTFSNDEHGAYIQGGGEYLLYDFGLAVGDTFEVVDYGDIVVSSIDSILIDSIYCRTLHFEGSSSPSFPWYQPLEYYWIEGIGSSTGFYPVFDYFEDQLYFQCFWDSYLTYFTNGYDCFDSAELEEETIEYSVYPNPVSDVLVIRSELPQNADGFITDLSGKVVLSFKLSASQTPLNVSHLKSGIYLLNVNGETHRIIKN
ncbi:MAG: T9SS type A sorting domain-containing protein [Crocinitomicaceae bacterium]